MLERKKSSDPLCEGWGQDFALALSLSLSLSSHSFVEIDGWMLGKIDKYHVGTWITTVFLSFFLNFTTFPKKIFRNYKLLSFLPLKRCTARCIHCVALCCVAHTWLSYTTTNLRIYLFIYIDRPRFPPPSSSHLRWFEAPKGVTVCRVPKSQPRHEEEESYVGSFLFPFLYVYVCECECGCGVCVLYVRLFFSQVKEKKKRRRSR